MARTFGRRSVVLSSGWLVALLLREAVPVSAQEATPASDPTIAALEQQKLGWEIAKLREETARLRSQNEQPVVDWLRNNAVVVAGLAGGGITLYRWWMDRREELRKRDEDRRAERDKREAEWREEREKRDEDRLAAVVDRLGSPDEPTRINAAHNLLAFLDPGYERFAPRILSLVVAHLRLQPEPAEGALTLFAQALVSVLKTAYPMVRAAGSPGPVWDEGPWPESPWPEEPDPGGPDATLLSVRPGSPLDMSGIKLPRANLAVTDLSGAWMPTADLAGANLVQIALLRANLDLANLGGADLGGADLREISLCVANLRDAKLISASLNGAKLQGADLTGAHLGFARAGKADLRGARLDEAELRLADLRGAILGDAHLADANLNEFDIRAAKVGVEVGKFSGASLRGANLAGADLRDAGLGGVDLSWAVLDGADLRGAKGLTAEQRRLAAEQGAILDEPEPST